MTFRLSLTVTALAAVLGACAAMPARAPTPAPSAQLNTPPTSDGAMGKYIEDVMAVNGPPSHLWDLPDGRRAYQWEQSSVTARVGDAARGEVVGAASQTTCYYTLYTHQTDQGRWTVIGAAPPAPGCLKVAMNGPAPPAAK